MKGEFSREFRCGDKVYETAGATSGAIDQGDFAGAYMLFNRMYEAGWRITEESAFMHVPWEKHIEAELFSYSETVQKRIDVL